MNRSPQACKASALPDELRAQIATYLCTDGVANHPHTSYFFISSSCYVSVELFSDFFAMLEKPTNQWCGRRDLNSYACAHEPKSCVSANFTTPAYFGGYRPTPAVVAFKVIRVIPHRSDTVLKVRLTQKDLLWLIFTRNYIAKTSVVHI